MRLTNVLLMHTQKLLVLNKYKWSPKIHGLDMDLKVFAILIITYLGVDAFIYKLLNQHLQTVDLSIHKGKWKEQNPFLNRATAGQSQQTTQKRSEAGCKCRFNSFLMCGFILHLYIQQYIFLCALKNVFVESLIYKTWNTFVNPSVCIH